MWAGRPTRHNYHQEKMRWEEATPIHQWVTSRHFLCKHEFSGILSCSRILELEWVLLTMIQNRFHTWLFSEVRPVSGHSLEGSVAPRHSLTIRGSLYPLITLATSYFAYYFLQIVRVYTKTEWTLVCFLVESERLSSPPIVESQKNIRSPLTIHCQCPFLSFCWLTFLNLF